MKNQIKNLKKRTQRVSTLALLMAQATIFVACNSDNDDPGMEFSNKTNDTVTTIPFFVENDKGEIPSSEDDLLYEFRLQNPVLNREGEHLTWADFGTVSGSASVTCMEGGFEVDLELAGLIPNGVYTFWNVTFNEGGMDTSKELLNIRGIGCIGSTDGSENYFIASSDGTGHISAFTQAPGSLSMIGDILACPIADEYEFHIVGAYHLDSKTWGANLGPDGTAVEQFGFFFKNDD